MRTDTLAAVLLSLLALSAAAAGAADPPSWPGEVWNPVPAEDDVVLPAPCGGAIAFRRVETPAAPNWLADEPLQLGNADVPGQEHAESIRRDAIVGSLSPSGAPDARFYLIGKYELTRDQYAAVMDETCPKPDDDGSVPVDAISWFDALAFTMRYTGWLHAEAPEALEAAAGAGAFIRLPTEEEWEFAARGGIAVPEAVQRQRLFPMDGPLETYVWFAGYKSCDGALQPVGLLEPNPLGLYDILGNAQEYVFDLYRLRTQSRAHGQVGGATARGGSCLTAEARVRTSERDELALFDPETGQPAGRAFTGMRLAVAAPILTGQQRIEAIHGDWAAMGDTRVQIAPGQDPLTTLDQVAAAEDNPEIRDALQAVAQGFRAEMQERNAVELRSARSVMLSGMLMIRDYLVERDNLERIAKIREAAPDPGLDAVIRRAEERLNLTRDVFLSALVHATDDFDQATLDAAAAIIAEENRVRLASASERTRETTGQMLAMFAEFTALYRNAPDTDPGVFYQRIEDYYAVLTGR